MVYHFYLRHNNDTDNIVPVVYRMNKEGFGCRVFVYQNHVGLKDDYRLEFLKGEGVPVTHTADITCTLNGLHGVAVFDHVKEGHIATPIRRCRELNIPTVALPHGMNVYSDGLHAKKRVVDYRFFDHIVTTDGLGSARYCKEWMDINQGLSTPHNIAWSSGTKVAWIQNTAEGYNNREATDLMLKKLPDDVLNCDFVLSPPLRTPAVDRPHSGWLVTRGEDGCSTLTTTQVVDWADVMLTTTSCTTAEYLIKGKPTISMPWLHRRKTSFDDYGACDRILNYKDLVRTLRGGLFATNDADKWIDDYVYAGKGKDYDVLGAYVKFITEKS